MPILHDEFGGFGIVTGENGIHACPSSGLPAHLETAATALDA